MSAEETVFVSETCIGEVCWCGEPAVRKVGEEFAYDEPNPQRHNLTRYICAHHYAELMGPLGAKHVGLPPPTPTEAAALWGCADGNGVDPRLIFRDRATAEQVAAGLGLTVQPLYTHPAPIKPSGDIGELRERVARIVDPAGFDDRWDVPGLRHEASLDERVDEALAKADAILDLIQSERPKALPMTAQDLADHAADAFDNALPDDALPHEVGRAWKAVGERLAAILAERAKE